MLRVDTLMQLPRLHQSQAVRPGVKKVARQCARAVSIFLPFTFYKGGQDVDSLRENIYDEGFSLRNGLAKWLDSDCCQAPSGAIAAWYDPSIDAQAFEYPEITGYWLTLAMARVAAQAVVQTRINAAKNWLTDRVLSGNLAAREDGTVYLFDLGMMATGLFHAARQFGSQNSLRAAMSLTAFIAEQTDGGRALAPIAGARHKARCSIWATDGTPHLLKLVQCLFLASDYGQPRAAETATAIYRHVCFHQGDDGRFPSWEDSSTTYLHPHLYAAEGLWIYAERTGSAEALARCEKAVTWVYERQLASGGFPQCFHAGKDAGTTEQNDVLAQAVRLACLLARGSTSPAVQRSISRLINFCSSARIGCALPYQSGTTVCHHNSWATMFGFQALQAAVRSADIGWSILV